MLAGQRPAADAQRDREHPATRRHQPGRLREPATPPRPAVPGRRSPHAAADGPRPLIACAPIGLRALRKPATPISRPAPTRATHGSSECPGRGAVPPKPVAGPPPGATLLPAASTRSSRNRWPGSSSTTIVWIVPAASAMLLLVRSVGPAALTCQSPGLTALYEVTDANGTLRA